MRYKGDVNEGFSLDTQILYKPYQAREFRLLMKTDFLMLFLMNLCNVLNVFLVSGVYDPCTGNFKIIHCCGITSDVCEER